MSELAAVGRAIRGHALGMSFRATTGHLGSALSCADLLAAVYFGGQLNLSPELVTHPLRDRFVFSKGHAISALYATLALRGYFPLVELETFNREGGRLPEQPAPGGVPGVEVATGSLGHGLSLGLGMALAAQIKGHDYRVVVLMSDGECNEGSVWEAALAAPAHGLNNIVVLIDYNKWQATGRSNEVLGLAPLREKWEAFGWDAIEVNGLDADAVAQLLERPSTPPQRPRCIVAHTLKGAGVSFMEDDNNWHYRSPNEAELALALGELGLT